MPKTRSRNRQPSPPPSDEEADENYTLKGNKSTMPQFPPFSKGTKVHTWISQIEDWFRLQGTLNKEIFNDEV